MPNAVGITEDLSRQWEDGRFGPEFCSSDMDANVFESRHLFGVTLLVDCVRFELCPSDIRDSGPSSEPGPNSVHDVVDNRVPSHFLACVVLFVSVLMTFVHTTVHLTLRKRAYALAAIACGVGFALFLLTREYHPGRHSQAIVILAAGVTLLVAGGWAWEFRRESVVNLPGASLKVVSYQSGKFEIAGFTLEYLESLRKYRRTSDP